MKETDFSRDILPLKDKLFRLALGITLNAAEAEDIVQETLLRAWSQRSVWQEVESVEAWCAAVARNLSVDWVRKAETRNVTLTDDMVSVADGSTTASSDPLSALVSTERADIVRRLIGALPPKQREVLVLRDVEGKSYQEIASALGISEDRVKVNLFRARQKVRQGLTDIENYGL